ncbi:MAG: MFS transporter, partial [Gammaproteobacteria bacterium]
MSSARGVVVKKSAIRNSYKIILTSIICYLIGIIFYSFDPLMQSFPSIITDQLMRTFAISSVGIGFVTASYYYSYNLMQIPAGILCDLHGTRKILFFSSIACTIGLLLFSFSTLVDEIIISRILMGLGASCAAVILVDISKEYFSVTYLPILVGIAQFAGNIGSICGQLPLSIVSDIYGWRTSILMLAIIPISVIIFTFLFMKNSAYDSSHKEYILKAIQKLKEVLLNKVNWLIALYAMFLWAPFYSFSSLWGIMLLKSTLNLSVENASKLIAISWIGSGIGSILIGMWSSYINKRKICIFFSAFLGLIVFPTILFSNSLMGISVFLFIFGMASAGQALSFA